MKLFEYSCLLLSLIPILSLSTGVSAKRVERPSQLSQDDIASLQSPVRPESFFNLSKRNLENSDVKIQEQECRFVHRAKNQCAFIHKYCEDERVGLLDYLDFYYCRLEHARAAALLLMGVWLALLFTTIGIAASDFFCVNLSTISTILGMSESMAGVTFLAFGNGSPDVFSTFAAMKVDSGSLAIGELIGAACFITAVVAGSMAIVRPFKVGRKSFIRDVSFFTLAVMFALFFLVDGEIHMWECIVMIVFYLLYVIFVIGWHWMAGRRKLRRRKERHAREHYTAPEEEHLLEDEDDEDGGVGGGQETENLHDFRALEEAENAQRGSEELDEEEQEQREFAELSNTIRVSRPGMERRITQTTTHSIRPSLVGAMEFRAVLNSLEKTKNLLGRQIHLRRYSDDPLFATQTHSAPATPDVTSGIADQRHTPQSLLKPSGSGHSRVRAVSVNDAAVREGLNADFLIPDLLSNDPDDQVGAERRAKSHDFDQAKRLQLHESQFLTLPEPSAGGSGRVVAQSPPISPSTVVSPGPLIDADHDSQSSSELMPLNVPIQGRANSPPTINLPRPSVDCSSSIYSLNGKQWRKFKYWPYDYLPPPQHIWDTFSPTLREFSDKTFIEKLFALVAVPSVFLLTITLPVVEGSTSDTSSPETKFKSPLPSESPTSFITSTTATTPMMHPSASSIDLSSPPSDGDWNRWLVALQCFTAPIFIVLVLFADSDTPLLKPILYALIAGLVSLACLLTFTSPTRPPKLRYLLCFVGFVVAISWISTIAEEVVGILKAFGVIFGISDAILGLTIFAVGNSLGDLVADITVARLGFPVMALSACFGGPMLNILLGIGISGLYMTLSKGTTVYRIEISSTLVISAVTLLTTLLVLLVWVPYNRWMMSRRIGWTLVGIWVVSTTVNVVVEVTGMGSKWGGKAE